MSIDCRFEVTQTGRAVDLLHEQTRLPKARIKDAMVKGAVWLTSPNGTARLRRASRIVNTGQTLSIYYNQRILNSPVPLPELMADREAYSVWYKPSGLMSSGTRYGDHHTIARQIEIKLQRPAYMVHRLDRFTRGIMLLAHKKQAAQHFARQFKERRTYKEYQARVVGELVEPVSVESPVDGKHAVSHITPLRAAKDESLVK